MSYDGIISINELTNSSTNVTEIRKISTNELAINNSTNVRNNGNNLNLSQSVTGKFKWDSLGSEWTTDFSYSFSRDNSNQAFATIFSQPMLPSSGGDGDIKGRLKFLSGQTNLLWKLPKKITIESGIKSTYVRFAN